ncbi:MAG: glycosyltransferase family 39 protein, partial [Chloroflexi bacterium]|nr:glycosyltransferase family 39 protein [Chloroflexota bacterium]
MSNGAGRRLWERSGPSLLMALVLLAALMLRLYRLGYQSLWADEGNSAIMAERTVGSIIENSAADIHPPLYYILLHWWSRLAGTSEIGLRLLSVIFGILLVLLIYKLGERLFNRWVGLVAAALAAMSPYLIYYSQEARMYMPVAALGTLSVYLMVLLIQRYLRSRIDRKLIGLALAYVAATATAIYTQYFAFSLLAFENILFILAFWRVPRHRTIWLIWLLAQAGLALLYLPWYVRVSGRITAWETSDAPRLGFEGLAHIVFRVFSLGRSWPAAANPAVEAFFVAFLLLGAMAIIAWGVRRASRDRAPAFMLSAAAILWLVVPFIVLYAVTRRSPLQFPEMVKQIIPSMPAFYILIAAGIVAFARLTTWLVRRRRLPSGATGLLGLAASGAISYFAYPSLHAYFTDPRYARDDYRGLARYVEMSSQPQDAVVLYDGGQKEIFDYYYRGNLPEYPLPRQRPIDETAAKAELEQMAGSYRRLWVIMWGMQGGDRNLFIERWLGENTYLASHRWIGSVQLGLYTTAPAGEIKASEKTLDASFGKQLRLLGYSLEGTVPAPDGVPTAKVGDVIALTLRWQAEGKPDKAYTVFTHLLDKQQYVWAQHDSPPAGNTRPTNTWNPGDMVEDRHGLQVPPGTPPGEYQVEVGVYDPATGVRLPVLDATGETNGDRILFGPVRV